MAQATSAPTPVTCHEGHQLVPGHAGLSQVRRLGPLIPCCSQGGGCAECFKVTGLKTVC